MNNTVKFHKANGPAFATGEEWYGVSGLKVTVDSVRKFGNAKWDYEVTYHWFETVVDDAGNKQTVKRECHKDAWNFQVRYQHRADCAFSPMKNVTFK